LFATEPRPHISVSNPSPEVLSIQPASK